MLHRLFAREGGALRWRLVILAFITTMLLVKVGDDVAGNRGVPSWGCNGSYAPAYFLVGTVDPGSPCAAAGIKTGDRLRSADFGAGNMRAFYAPHDGDRFRVIVANARGTRTVEVRFTRSARAPDLAIFADTALVAIVLIIAMITAIYGKPPFESLVLSVVITLAAMPAHAVVYPRWFEYAVIVTSPLRLGLIVPAAVFWYLLFMPSSIAPARKNPASLAVFGILVWLSALWALVATYRSTLGLVPDPVGSGADMSILLTIAAVVWTTFHLAWTVRTREASPLYRRWKLLTMTVAGTILIVSVALSPYANLQRPAIVLYGIFIVSMFALLAAAYVFGVDLPFGTLRRTVTSSATSLVIVAIFSVVQYFLNELPKMSGNRAGSDATLAIVAVVLAAYVKTLHDTIAARLDQYFSHLRGNLENELEPLRKRIPAYQDEASMLDDVGTKLCTQLGMSVTLFRYAAGDSELAAVGSVAGEPLRRDDEPVLDMIALGGVVDVVGPPGANDSIFVPFIAIGRFYGCAKIERPKEHDRLDRECLDALQRIGAAVGEAFARREIEAAETTAKARADVAP